MSRPDTASAPSEADSPDRLALILMAVGFGLGSIGFMLGALVSILGTHAPSELLRGGALLFAGGALFFTSAAFVQWRTSVQHHPSYHSARRHAEADLRNPDWDAAIVQLVGTLYFNVMTIRALSIMPFSVDQFNAMVWQPDLLGSALFLLSSLIALHPISRARRHRLLSNNRSVAIVMANLAGSVLFAVSAIGSHAVNPGDLTHPGWNNYGTLLGGLAFLISSVLMWPPRNPAAPVAASC